MRRYCLQRPNNFTIDSTHYLARGLVFAGLAPGGMVGSTRYHDSSLYGNHGTLTNGPDWTFDPTLGRWCLSCDGNQDYIVIPKTPSIKAISLWVNHVHSGGPSTYAYLFDARLGGGTGYVYTTAYSPSNERIVPSSGTWYHDGVAGGYYAPNTWVNVVVNGITTTISASGFPIGIKNDLSSDDYQGYIADFMAWDRSLSLSEISQLANPSNTLLSGLILPPRRMVFPAAVVSGGIDYKVYRKMNYYRKLRSF